MHANFIVNGGRATAADVLALVRRVRSEVKARTGVELQPEVLARNSVSFLRLRSRKAATHRFMLPTPHVSHDVLLR